MGPGGWHEHGGPGGAGGSAHWPGGPGWYPGHGWFVVDGVPGGPHWPAGLPWWWGWWPVLPTFALAALVLTVVVLVCQRGAILLNRTPVLTGADPDPELWWRAAWERAVHRHRVTARAFAAYECDPGAALRLPALADVAEPATGRFVDAFAEATALATDGYPGHGYAQRFVAAAERAEHAWAAAVEAAERIRDARFAPGERRLVAQVEALLALALASPFEPERRGAYQRAQRKLGELERRTGWRLPRPAQVELTGRAHPELAAAG